MPQFLRTSVRLQYVSMRVHGTSAHVSSEPPILPQKLVVQHLPGGTLIASNYAVHIAVHFSIPTPLISIESIVPVTPSSVFRGQNSDDLSVAPVFGGSSIHVERVALDVSVKNPLTAVFDSVEVWDGGRLILNSHTDDPLREYGTDPYIEPAIPNSGTLIERDVGKRVYSAVGITLRAHFQDFDIEKNILTFHSAKAIFAISN
jgi:hypothetical protein